MSPQPRPTKPFLAAIAGEPVATRPFWLMRQAGRYLPEYRTLRQQAGGFLDLCLDVERAVEVTLQPIRRFGMDAAILFSDILVVPWALGQDLAFQEGEGPKLDPIDSATDLRRLADRLDLDRLAPVYEILRTLADSLPAETALIGFAGAPWTLSTYMVEGGSSRDFARVRAWQETDPDGFGRLIARLTDAVTLHLDRQIEAGAEAVQIFDSWAGALDGAAYDRWVIAPTRAIVSALRDRHPRVPIIGFPRGSGDVYARYVAEIGIDMVSIDQAVDPDWAAATLQPRVAVQGNLDPALLVTGGAALDDAVRHLLARLGSGRYVFNLGHGVVPETPPDNVRRLAELIRSLPVSA